MLCLVGFNRLKALADEMNECRAQCLDHTKGWISIMADHFLGLGANQGNHLKMGWSPLPRHAGYTGNR